MKIKRRIILLITLSFSMLLILTFCREGNKQEGKPPRLMPTEHGTISESIGHESTTDNMHKQHNSLANNFTHKDIVILEHPYQLAQAAVKNKMNKVLLIPACTIKYT